MSVKLIHGENQWKFLIHFLYCRLIDSKQISSFRAVFCSNNPLFHLYICILNIQGTWKQSLKRNCCITGLPTHNFISGLIQMN